MKIERISQIEKFLSPENFGVYKLDHPMQSGSLKIPHNHFLLFDFDKKIFTHSPELKESNQIEWKDFSIGDLEELDPEFSVVAVKAV